MSTKKELKGGDSGGPSRARYSLNLIEQIVEQVESGASRKSLCTTYGMAAVTLQSWIRRHCTAAYQSKMRSQFSPGLKRSIVTAILQGRMTLQEACVAHKIKDKQHIKRWIHEFKRENADLTVIALPIMSKKHPSAHQSEEVKALEKALAMAHLKIAALETMVDIAEQQFKIDIRKKSGAKQSSK